jgi:hypothetical protein
MQKVKYLAVAVVAAGFLSAGLAVHNSNIQLANDAWASVESANHTITVSCTAADTSLHADDDLVTVTVNAGDGVSADSTGCVTDANRVGGAILGEGLAIASEACDVVGTNIEANYPAGYVMLQGLPCSLVTSGSMNVVDSNGVTDASDISVAFQVPGSASYVAATSVDSSTGTMNGTAVAVDMFALASGNLASAEVTDAGDLAGEDGNLTFGGNGATIGQGGYEVWIQFDMTNSTIGSDSETFTYTVTGS